MRRLLPAPVVLSIYGVPALRWLDGKVRDFSGYLGRWVDLFDEAA